MATMPVPGSGESTFAAPHAVDTIDVVFDLSKRRLGVCKFFNSQKGFGFINDHNPDQLGNQEVFVHYTAITGKGGFRSLAEGEEVEYLLQPGSKGFQATEVSGPSGRAVQGDPKAKLPKTPTFMPYPAMGMIPYLGAPGTPYMTDPYLQQQAGVYAASPYTSHVLYVPSSMGSFPVQYAAAGMSPQVGLNGGQLNGLGGAMRSPQQGFGQPGIAISPQLAGGFGGFSGASMGAGGEAMRSPVSAANGGASGAFAAGQSFAMPTSSGLGLRSDGSRVSAERMDDGSRGTGVGRGGVDGGNGFGGFGGSNSLLYSSNGQSGF